MAIRTSDQISIVDLTDGYSVVLTNDSHTFLGDTSKAIAASTQTTVIAMCGASQVAASVNLDDVVKPTGVNVTKDTDATQPTLTIEVMEACDEILRSLLDTSTLDDKRKRVEHERDAVTGQIQALVERQARETVEAFTEKYQELEKKYRRAEERIKAVGIERRDREYRLKQAELFVATLKKLPEGEPIESTELFMALVEKVIVGEGLTFVLRDGSEKVLTGV